MNKYLKAVSHNFVFFFLSTISYLLLTPLAIRVMGDEFFGLWAILFAIAQFANLGTLGIGSVVNKFASEGECTNSDANVIISSALLIILPMAFLTMLALFILKDLFVSSINPSLVYIKQFNTAILVAIFSLLPQFTNKIFQGYFLAQIKNKLVRTMDFISSIFPLLGGVIITSFQRNLVWIAVWNLILQLVISIVYIASLMRVMNIVWLPKKSMIKRMYGFSVFMFVESLAIRLFQQFDRVLVGITLGPVLAGVYSVATSVGLRMSLISGQITEVMTPYASLKDSLGEEKLLYDTFRRISAYISLMIAVFASLSIIWMFEILSIWISAEYASMYSTIFNVLIMAYGIMSLSRPAHQTLTGLGQVKFTSLLYVFSSIIMLTALYFLSQRYGIIGAALANILMVVLLIMNFYTYKFLDKKFHWKTLISDLKWGISLPIIAFFVTFLVLPIYQKIIFSFLIVMVLINAIARDQFLKEKLTQMLLHKDLA